MGRVYVSGKMAKKKNPQHRPAGTPNKKSQFVRTDTFAVRFTRGANEVMKELIAQGQYKTKADVLHDALQVLAHRKLPHDYYWINKIQ
jgi:hypothetical protein